MPRAARITVFRGVWEAGCPTGSSQHILEVAGELVPGTRSCLRALVLQAVCVLPCEAQKASGKTGLAWRHLPAAVSLGGSQAPVRTAGLGWHRYALSSLGGEDHCWHGVLGSSAGVTELVGVRRAVGVCRWQEA